jgi:hypothetical protein
LVKGDACGRLTPLALLKSHEDFARTLDCDGHRHAIFPRLAALGSLVSVWEKSTVKVVQQSRPGHEKQQKAREPTRSGPLFAFNAMVFCTFVHSASELGS